MHKILRIFQLFLFFSLLSGCAAAGMIAGPIITGYITWKNGEATKYYEYKTTVIDRSIKKALKELDLKVEKEVPSNNNFTISAGNNDRFKIRINEIEPNITRLSIRINFMGDKPYAELIYKKVDYFLGEIEYDENGIPVRLNNT